MKKTRPSRVLIRMLAALPDEELKDVLRLVQRERARPAKRPKRKTPTSKSRRRKASARMVSERRRPRVSRYDGYWRNGSSPTEIIRIQHLGHYKYRVTTLDVRHLRGAESQMTKRAVQRMGAAALKDLLYPCEVLRWEELDWAPRDKEPEDINWRVYGDDVRDPVHSIPQTGKRYTPPQWPNGDRNWT